jgi:hypothetical protein
MTIGINNQFPNILNDIINTYFSDNPNDQIFTYFRIFYLFKVIIIFILKIKKSKEELLEIFINFFDETVQLQAIKNKSKEIIKSNIIKHYNFFYETFFVDDNIYFNVYFNNLSKYFLPIPYVCSLYSPLITYRSNVTSLYKKNDKDFILQSDGEDYINISSNQNTNANKNEIDMHISMEHFDEILFDDVIYYIATRSNLYIATSIVIHDNICDLKCVYMRPMFKYDKKHLYNKIPFELLAPKWKEYNKNFNINWTDIKYISVNRKITKNDLFHVFEPMNFSTNDYKYFFHNVYKTYKIELNKMLLNPLFVYLTPLTSGSGILSQSDDDKYRDRKCIIFELENDLTNILNLTKTIVTSNPLTKYLEEKDINDWISYDNLNIMDYYKNDINVYKKITNINNQCITSDNITITELKNKRPYCDIGTTSEYVGRRKLHEILFKTRKYEPKNILKFLHYENKYKKSGFDEQKYSLYYPNESIFEMTYDSFAVDLFKTLKISGFFFTDYQYSFNTGGELLVTFPKDNMKFMMEFDQNCSSKINKIDKNQNNLERDKLSRDSKQVPIPKYAYITLLMGTNSYFYGALVTGYSLQKYKVNANIDIVIMITNNVSAYQKNILQKVYDQVIEIDFTEIDKNIIDDLKNTRFMDVFTKLEALKFTQYSKIIMMDIDMCVLKNMDHLFDLNSPAASLRNIDLEQGDKIDKKYIYSDNQGNVHGINAGLMLLKPSIEEYNDIIKDLRESKNRKYKNPEQDYLSLRYRDKWTNISFLYNFQFGLTKRVDKLNYTTEDIYNLHYSSRLKPWLQIYEKEHIRDKIIPNKQYYDIWEKEFLEINKKFNLLPKYLEFNHNLNNFVSSKMKNILLSNKYKIIGSYKTKFVTDIDITNYIEKNVNGQHLKDLIDKLPSNIKFISINTGKYFDITDYLQIVWTSNIKNAKNQAKIVMFKKEELIEKLNSIDCDDYIRRNVIQMLNKDPIKCYNDLDQLSKMKVYSYNLNKLDSVKSLANMIAHFGIKFNSHYIYVDVAFICNELKINNSNNSNDYNNRVGLMYYLNEYFYIVNSMKRNKKHYESINNLVNYRYGMYKQLMMDLFYLYFFSKNKVLDKNEFVEYSDLLIYNIERSFYYDKNESFLLETMKNNIKNIRNNSIDYSSEQVYSNVKKLNADLFKWLNDEFIGYLEYYSNN